MATQRAARQLVATALTVLLAKVYGVDLTGLQLFGVAIDPATVAGAAFIVVAFQLATFLVHWGGDWFSLVPWNSSERVTGMSRWSVPARTLDQIGVIDERLETVEDKAKELTGQSDQAAIDRLTVELLAVKKGLADLRRSAVNYGRYGLFYIYGLYLALPVAVAVAALSWPSPNAAPVHP